MFSVTAYQPYQGNKLIANIRHTSPTKLLQSTNLEKYPLTGWFSSLSISSHVNGTCVKEMRITILVKLVFLMGILKVICRLLP